MIEMVDLRTVVMSMALVSGLTFHLMMKDKNHRLVTVVVILVLVFLFFSSLESSAQSVSGFVEYEHVVVNGEATPEVNLYAHGPLKGRLGWTVWTLTTKPWSEALIGLSFAPAKWIEVSGKVGIETADNSQRFGASLWLGKGKFSLLSFIEDGGSVEWHKNILTYQATESVAIGLLNQKFLGTGPYAEKKIGKITVWGTWVEGKSGLMGGRFNF